jgi:hypothetical protein
MPPLIEFQRTLAADILFGGTASARYLRGGSLRPDAGIAVHRNSVMGALANAIRLSCPTLSALVDANFFEQSVRDYARSRPPPSACLEAFGEGFARFLEMYPPAKGFPFFGDIVRFDLAIDQASRGLPRVYGAAIALAPGSSCRLLASLRQMSARYPVDIVRDETEAGDFRGLERLDMTPRVQHFALWADESGARVRKLTDPAAAFLRALLDGRDGCRALSDALEYAEPHEALGAIQREIFVPPIAIIGVDPNSEQYP